MVPITCFKIRRNERSLSSGRPQLLTPRDKRRIVSNIKKDRWSTLDDLVDYASADTGKNVNKVTMQPFLTKAHIAKRRAWYKTVQDWNGQWETVIWSDESTFVLYKKNSNRNLWGQTCERFDTDYFAPKVQGNDENMDGPRYVEVLRDHFLSFLHVLPVPSSGGYNFQKEHFRAHKSKAAGKFKKEHGIDVLEWVSNSLNPSPI
ncbi:hypothetical protein PHYBLDRAFT_149360 [Phycomyces blakesleeanus NRRL 1555(-)]|uniref:Homeodomain-like DNA binding domain-containing transcription factor n=1 Tax=Phycomyces blakesleeanus (strain ATCC 8743b / DSM 1359 / FGSC 10004 / NBRC 33097 / NRRL 1555) TaxID=763407 RepID=A0A162ZWY5_PHYB8|nr:hypothetical protein PHYBLDRAFT_149360 [Phycomyces blakesleeanus NRRL 1555(-)]OAD69571.1 hypothetical protein PHYBLDRAFT_149360 [Phycomyces blakesleeanus NRRL 1555(-)]|eukprot:XP_018287611.1 hypothetical protein PHYBLDRAFT_149360 [Phycomyces blakesleeanus NRRL 1555(-)]